MSKDRVSQSSRSTRTDRTSASTDIHDIRALTSTGAIPVQHRRSRPTHDDGRGGDGA